MPSSYHPATGSTPGLPTVIGVNPNGAGMTAPGSGATVVDVFNNDTQFFKNGVSNYANQAITASSPIGPFNDFFVGNGLDTDYHLGTDFFSIFEAFFVGSDGACTATSFTGAGALTTDTGWTANSDAGDKTKIIGTSASISTIASALNIVSAGSGTLLQNVAEKCKALETALVASLKPNA